MPSATMKVRGINLRTQTQRRWVMVVVRPEPYVDDRGTHVPFARVEKRSDRLSTVQTERVRFNNRNRGARGMVAVTMDTVTGREVE